MKKYLESIKAILTMPMYVPEKCMRGGAMQEIIYLPIILPVLVYMVVKQSCIGYVETSATLEGLIVGIASSVIFCSVYFSIYILLVIPYYLIMYEVNKKSSYAVDKEKATSVLRVALGVAVINISNTYVELGEVTGIVMKVLGAMLLLSTVFKIELPKSQLGEVLSKILIKLNKIHGVLMIIMLVIYPLLLLIAGGLILTLIRLVSVVYGKAIVTGLLLVWLSLLIERIKTTRVDRRLKGKGVTLKTEMEKIEEVRILKEKIEEKVEQIKYDRSEKKTEKEIEEEAKKIRELIKLLLEVTEVAVIVLLANVVLSGVGSIIRLILGVGVFIIVLKIILSKR